MIVVKTFVFLTGIIILQSFSSSQDNSGEDAHISWAHKFLVPEYSVEMASKPIIMILLLELCGFYASIIATIFILLINTFKKFYSLRDKVGLTEPNKKVTDFFQYHFNDLHWFIIFFMQTSLGIVTVIGNQQYMSVAC